MSDIERVSKKAWENPDETRARYGTVFLSETSKADDRRSIESFFEGAEKAVNWNE